LTNRSVLVDSAALKEAVMHHALGKQKNEEKKDCDKQNFHESRPRRLWIRLWCRFQIGFRQCCLFANPAQNSMPETPVSGASPGGEVCRIQVLAFNVASRS
jgi:hypothetical protein